MEPVAPHTTASRPRRRDGTFVVVPARERWDVLDAASPRAVARRELDGAACFLLRHVLSPAECARWIARAERAGFERAGLAVGDDAYRVSDWARNNTRVMFEDEALADALFARVRARLEPRWSGLALAGLNWRFRVYRYAPGQRYRPHVDRVFAVPARRVRTQFSFMLYLNAGCEGGETTFFEPAARSMRGARRGEVRLTVRHAVAPEAGAALVFDHGLLHEGSLVRAGYKYAVRTDVFYAEG